MVGISAARMIDSQTSYSYSNSFESGQADPNNQVHQINQEKIEVQSATAVKDDEVQEKKEKKEKKEMNRDDAANMTAEMNKFMQLLNADIKFVLHEKTKTLMVQVVDSKDHKVLKEFPPHELLDTKAKIKDYIGLILDKRV